jgi:hypothetical protein
MICSAAYEDSKSFWHPNEHCHIGCQTDGNLKRVQIYMILLLLCEHPLHLQYYVSIYRAARIFLFYNQITRF